MVGLYFMFKLDVDKTAIDVDFSLIYTCDLSGV